MGGDRLLEEAREKFAARPRGPPVEAERELVRPQACPAGTHAGASAAHPGRLGTTAGSTDELDIESQFQSLPATIGDCRAARNSDCSQSRPVAE